MKKHCISLFILAHLCARAETTLSVKPAHSSGLPGELQQVELRIEMGSPEKATLRVPHSSNLVLRAVERYPVTRTADKRYLQKRLLVFQGTEAGTSVLTNLLLETVSGTHCFPPLEIEVLPVEKIAPPVPSEKVQASEDAPVKKPVKTQDKDAP